MSARWNAAVAVMTGFVLVGLSQGAAKAVSTYGGPCYKPITDPIGPGGEITQVAIDVPDHLMISDIDVGISITHGSVFDLQLFIQSPAGTRITLNAYNLNEYFVGQNYSGTVFDDEAAIHIKQGSPPFEGCFRPLEPYQLSAFDGEDTAGRWLLDVYDKYPEHAGTIDSFELFITAPEPGTAVLFAIGAILLRAARRQRSVR